MRPWLLLGSTGRKSLNQVISGSGIPLAAHSMVAVLVRSTTFSWGPMSMLGKPNGRRSSETQNKKTKQTNKKKEENDENSQSSKQDLEQSRQNWTKSSCGLRGGVSREQFNRDSNRKKKEKNTLDHL